jgi:hypothetical protein
MAKKLDTKVIKTTIKPLNPFRNLCISAFSFVLVYIPFLRPTTIFGIPRPRLTPLFEADSMKILLHNAAIIERFILMFGKLPKSHLNNTIFKELLF